MRGNKIIPSLCFCWELIWFLIYKITRFFYEKTLGSLGFGVNSDVTEEMGALYRCKALDIHQILCALYLYVIEKHLQLLVHKISLKKK